MLWAFPLQLGHPYSLLSHMIGGEANRSVRFVKLALDAGTLYPSSPDLADTQRLNRRRVQSRGLASQPSACARRRRTASGRDGRGSG